MQCACFHAPPLSHMIADRPASDSTWRISLQGCAEIRWLAEKMGAKPATVSGLSGLGDIMLTCYGALSRNRSVGIRLGQGQALDDILASSTQVRPPPSATPRFFFGPCHAGRGDTGSGCRTAKGLSQGRAGAPLCLQPMCCSRCPPAQAQPCNSASILLGARQWLAACSLPPATLLPLSLCA